MRTNAEHGVKDQGSATVFLGTGKVACERASGPIGSRTMKIGFMGGSFDPVHFGHLVAAQDALERGKLDRLVFVPAAQAPLKPGVVQAPAEARLGMLRAALDGDARFEVSDYEMWKGGMRSVSW
jgi:cytidyltransferase-like protein